MNFSEYIKDLLLKNGEAKIPGFGIFSLKNSSASYNNSDGTFSPPAKKIVFYTDYFVENQNIANDFAKVKNISEDQAVQNITGEVNFWKKKISAAENFQIFGIGNFAFDNEKIIFEGERLDAEIPENFGLEKISVKNFGTANVNNGKFWRWLLPLLLILGGLSAFALNFPQYFFGKKSFEEPFQKSESLPNNQVAIPAKISDSTKTDSAKVDSAKANIPKIAAVPAAAVATKAVAPKKSAKKYYPKKSYAKKRYKTSYKRPYKKSYTKKYYKKTWSKAKKRRTR